MFVLADEVSVVEPERVTARLSRERIEMKKIGLAALILYVLLVATAACTPALPPQPTASPTAAPTGTRTAVPTGIPSTPTAIPPRPTATAALTPSIAWTTYSDAPLGVTLRYPADWRPVPGYEGRYTGSDGFFQLSAISGAGAMIDQVAEDDAHHRLQPYGSEPTIESLRLQGREARLILPSADQPAAMKGQAGLIVHLPQPIEISGRKYDYLILWADQQHIREIAKTIALQTPAR
jgi:hypothetical protein